MKNFTAILCALVALAGSGLAEESQFFITGGPGTYTNNNDSDQMVTHTYEVSGVKLENMSNVIALFQSMLKKDGAGGQCKGAPQIQSDGSVVILLTITATEKMQASIQQTIDMINQGETQIFTLAQFVINFTPKFQTAENLLKVISNELTAIGYAYVDEGTNQLTIVDDASLEEYFRGILNTYDVMPKQAVVEIRVIETKAGVQENLGPHFDAFTKALPTNASLSLSGARSIDGLQITGFETLLNNISLQELTRFFNFLQTQEVANIGSKITVNVVNGEVATIRANQELHSTSVSSDGKLTNEIVLEGLLITIKAKIAEILAQIEINASITSANGLNEDGQQVLSTYEVSTIAHVVGEKAFVLSGLKRSCSIKRMSKVPWLGDIPFIGPAFCREQSKEEERDITLIIRVYPS